MTAYSAYDPGFPSPSGRGGFSPYHDADPVADFFEDDAQRGTGTVLAALLVHSALFFALSSNFVVPDLKPDEPEIVPVRIVSYEAPQPQPIPETEPVPETQPVEAPPPVPTPAPSPRPAPAPPPVPEPQPQPEPQSDPEPQPQPERESEPEPEPALEPTPVPPPPEILSQPVVDPEPDVLALPDPEPIPEPIPETVIDPVPEPAPIPEPDPQAVIETAPLPDIMPDPVIDPAPIVPEPAPIVMPDPLPKRSIETSPIPEPDPRPQTAIMPDPVPEPEPLVAEPLVAEPLVPEPMEPDVVTVPQTILASPEAPETITEQRRAVSEDEADPFLDLMRRDRPLGPANPAPVQPAPQRSLSGPATGGGNIGDPPGGGTQRATPGAGGWTLAPGSYGNSPGAGYDGINLDMRCREANKTHLECPEYIRTFQGRDAAGFEDYDRYRPRGTDRGPQDETRATGRGIVSRRAVGEFGSTPGSSMSNIDDGPEVDFSREFLGNPVTIRDDPRRLRDLLTEPEDDEDVIEIEEFVQPDPEDGP
ncbi:hypothetical protein [uncultured Algimonas sp.]|uniref:hypothetical protein n=1 Tax=uncultured Algimonas sp. TaxID=1547920 RepID=UPI00261AF558|nr:hypothetical protein [uncultured Algimonas sp.]